MIKKLLVHEISASPYKFNTSKTTVDKFLKLLDSKEKLTKGEGNGIHICSFFLPINLKTKSIYLVDHIKAQMWIPPGGHIEANERPQQTVIREFEEELDHRLTDEKITLFDLSITPINRPWHNCITHYDFWYLVEVDKIPFQFLKKEFYSGDWFGYEAGLKKISRPSYRKILKNLIERL